MVKTSGAIERLSVSLRANLHADPATDRAAGMVSLFNGDPDLATPGWICEAATAAMRDGFTHYPPNQGDVELRDAIAETLNEQHGQDLTVDDILITNGSSSAIFSTVMAFVSPGDEVLLLDPCYSLYEDAVRVAGGVAVRVKLTDDFHIDEALLEQAVTPRCKMLIICSPCNPTALVLTRAELEAVERVAAKYDFLVVSDEVYHRIVYDGREFISVMDLPELSRRALLLQSFSKSYAMTGWRLGYIAARGGLSKSAAAIQRTAMGAVNSITQRAGLAVMRAPRELADPWFREMLGVYERRRRMGQALLDEMPKVSYHLPEATFYYWVKVDTALSSVDLIGYLRQEARVALHSGTEYGPAGEGYIRFSYAAPDEEFHEGLTRVGEALARLDR